MLLIAALHLGSITAIHEHVLLHSKYILFMEAAAVLFSYPRGILTFFMVFWKDSYVHSKEAKSFEGKNAGHILLNQVLNALRSLIHKQYSQ